MKTCQACQTPLSAADLAADFYAKLCLTCWDRWQVEAGEPLERYLKKIGNQKCVCAACGMTFGGLTGFDRHRHQDRCRSPAELKAQNRPLTIKNGIWVKDSSKDAFFSNTGKPRSDSVEKTIVGQHPKNPHAPTPVAGENFA